MLDKIRQKIIDRDYYLFSWNPMNCELCNGQTITKKVRKQHWLGGNLYIIENVEAEVCLECGERYFHAKTLDRIDALLKAEHPIKAKLSVEVVSL